MFVEDRQNSILEFIKREGKAEVWKLSAEFGKSPETVRRDLRRLEQFGLVKRTRGGAVLLDSTSECCKETPTIFRQSINSDKKMMIAKRAAEFVKNEDVLLLDDSTTVSHILRYLPKSFSLTIITNSIPVINQLQEYSNDGNWTVVCLGGILRNRTNSLTGFLALNTLSTFRPNKLFMSCGGVDNRGNLTEGSLSTVELKKEFLKHCEEVYLLLDDSKIGTPVTVNLTEMRRVDCLIVSEMDSEKTERVKKMGAKSVVFV